MLKGSKRTEETKKKMSFSHKGKPSGALGKHWKVKDATKMGLAFKDKERTEETKRKISLALKNKKISGQHRKNISDGQKKLVMEGKHHLYKGGITSLNKQIRNSFEYRLWREAVFKRDNFQCIWGGAEHGSKLNADHVKPFASYPELRFVIDNGRTLCVDCHRKTDTYGNKYKKSLIGGNI